jgi:exodeoxyribonuclease VII large subunit
MGQALERRLGREADRLRRIEQLRGSLDPNRPLELGFARVHRGDGGLVRRGAELAAGDAIRLVFADGERRAVVDGTAKAKPARSAAPAGQGNLF